MATIKKSLKKGGEARWTFRGAQSGDFFTIPNGFRVATDGVVLENNTTVPVEGTISIGKGSVPIFGAYAFTLSTLTTATTGTITAGGALSFTTALTAAQVTAVNALGNTAAGLALFASSLVGNINATAAGAAAAAAATTNPGYLSPWTVSSSGAVITFVAPVPGTVNTAPTFTGSAGVTISAAVNTAVGANDVSVLSGYSVASLAPGAITQVTLPAPIYNDVATGGRLNTVFTGTTSGSAGSYVLCGKTVSIPTSTTALQTGVVLGGRSIYVSTISGYVGTAGITVNGVAVTALASSLAGIVNGIANTNVPGWTIFSDGATIFTMIANLPGPTSMPVIVTAGQFTNTPSTQTVGFNLPGYIADTSTPIATTITLNGNAGALASAVIGGNYVAAPYLAALTYTPTIMAPVFAGCAWYQGVMTGAPTATTQIVIDGVSSIACGATSLASLMTAMAGLSGVNWIITNVAGGSFLMVNTVPGYHAPPVISFTNNNNAAVGTITSGPGFTLSGYTQTYTATTAVFTSQATTYAPGMSFYPVVAPTTQTWIKNAAYSGSTGGVIVSNDIVNTVGYSAPTLTVGSTIGTQTYVNTLTSTDTPYFFTFSRSEMHGKTNVSVLLKKWS